MEITPELLEILNAPDAVDFVVRKDDFIMNNLSNNPNIYLTQTLIDRYIIGYVKEKNYDQLIKALGASFISALPTVLGTLDRPGLEAAGIIQTQNQPYLDLKGRNVLIGFVDTGIDYTQPVFINEDGTSKIQYIFDQDTPATGFTEEIFIGVEYTNEQINEALKAPNPYDIVPHRDTSGHGTFLASVAAGNSYNDFLSAAPAADIIMVKLKPPRQFYLNLYCVPPEQQNVFGSNAVLVGVEFILRKAKELKRPVVICIGLGTNFGGHDGNSIFEEYLSNISNNAGICLCTAIGNEAQQRHHTQGDLKNQGDTKNIDIKVGDNAGNIYVNIWNNVSDRFSVSVRSPTGEYISRIPAKPNTTSEIALVLENARVTISYHFPVEGTGGQASIVRILNATPGIWTITLHGDIVLNGTYHAWLPINGFVSPTVEFLETTPYNTVTIPSTANGTISVGAYNSQNNSLYINSSWGPTRLDVMRPDFIAPGVNVGGYFPYGYGTLSGTSAAVAITAGACALFLEWGVIRENDISLSTFQIRAYLIRGCTRSDNVIYPNVQNGYGRMNVFNSFNLMREV